jgi:hypothetical protein
MAPTNKQKVKRLTETLVSFRDHLEEKSDAVIEKIEKHVPDRDPQSLEAEMMYLHYIVSIAAHILNDDVDKGELSYDDVNELLVLIEGCNNKLIPFEKSPVYMLGRIAQQVKTCIVNLERDCYDPDIEKCVMTNDAMYDCVDDFNAATILSEKLNEILQDE